MTPRAYNGKNGIRYTPGRKIGQGGEGTVFEVQENTSLVIKVYNEALNSDKSEKLLYMASIANDELVKFAAWPLDVLFDQSQKICGFVMNKLQAYVPLHSLFSPMERKKLFPDKGYNFLIHVARNLATAFHKIHQLGIIIGDVNEANVLVNPNGMIALIDCDSFQVKNGNRYHFCEVGIPRYTAPELLEKGSFNNVVRTINTDSFSLATLIFQLLFLGRAPFTGINLSKEEFDEEKAIRTKEFAYSLLRTHKKLLPAKNSLDFKNLSPGIINLFHESFENIGTRPAPAQWAGELDELGRTIIQCPQSRLHFYPKMMRECPWCMFEKKAGIVYFLDDAYLNAIPELNNIEQFLNGFKLDRLEVRKLTENYATGNLKPARINSGFIDLKNLNIGLYCILILVTVWALIYLRLGIALASGIFMAVFKTLSPMQWQLDKEITRRQKNFDAMLKSFQTLIKKHNNSADFKKYNQSSIKLTGLINTYRNLPVGFTTHKKKIEEKYYNIQYKAFLEPFDILQQPIPAFGPAKKQLIYNNGIRNAADIIKLKSTKISGIGPKNIQLLVDWQRQIGTGFVYKPDLVSISREISAAINDIVVKKRRLEIDITFETKNLSNIKSAILLNAEAVEQKYTELARKVYQAELDLRAFKEFNKKFFVWRGNF